ncbi:SAM-dependent methyltransferase [Cellulosilyticum ruminicola]|uniref:SAM-dependent methyltransferase n=1 Tax=Cellulosilyticum ruminicola TaxID=425254 RepID=UPI0006D08764|nr:cyclopropane-fatty-acyl-phospholipid synthase family protein [Cellulosilyticum ruminicola]
MSIQAILMKKFLNRFDGTAFDVMFESGEEFHIGELPSKFKVVFHKPVPYRDLMKSTSLALGEAYMNGEMEIEGDLVMALDEIFKFQSQFITDKHAMKKILYTSGTKSNQKKEVSSHYDIGNDFYKLWLDPTLSYSCAYFKKDDNSLEEAQINKVGYILKKLSLQQGMSLLDIGCGWGFLLIEAAKKYRIHGLGITLSEQQYKEFKKRIAEEKLEDYLDVQLIDYRDLKHMERKFDRIVSVGMLEHVGRENYEQFFKSVDAVMKEKGVFLLHYISGLREHPGDAWIKKYIFPGGVIPSLREIIDLSADYGYHVRDIESLRQHYVRTLLNWHDNFEQNIDQVKKMFDERFIRMWRMYLCACAASFNNGVVDLHQILFTKGVNNNLPLTREHLYKE